MSLIPSWFMVLSGLLDLLSLVVLSVTARRVFEVSVKTMHLSPFSTKSTFASCILKCFC